MGGQPEVPHDAGHCPLGSHSAAWVSAPTQRSNPTVGQGEVCVRVGTQLWAQDMYDLGGNRAEGL